MPLYHSTNPNPNPNPRSCPCTILLGYASNLVSLSTSYILTPLYLLYHYTLVSAYHVILLPRSPVPSLYPVYPCTSLPVYPSTSQSVVWVDLGLDWLGVQMLELGLGLGLDWLGVKMLELHNFNINVVPFWRQWPCTRSSKITVKITVKITFKITVQIPSKTRLNSVRTPSKLRQITVKTTVN